MKYITQKFKLIILLIVLSINTMNMVIILNNQNSRSTNGCFFVTETSTFDSVTKPILSVSSDDSIGIFLVSPFNNSIHNSGTIILIEFKNSTGHVITPVTELYRWDYGSNYESMLRPLPSEDGQHILEVEVESFVGEWNYSRFVFYSDNTPFEVSLDNLENQTHKFGGSDIFYWSSDYVSGSINTICFSDLHKDNDYDIFVGGTSRRVYAFDGRDGSPSGLSSEFGFDVEKIANIDNDSVIVGLSNGYITILRNSDLTSTWSNSSSSSSVIDIHNDLISANLIILDLKSLRSFNYTGGFKWNVTFSDNDIQSKLIVGNVLGNISNEIILINSSSHVKIFNSTDGSLITSFQSVTISSAVSVFGSLIVGSDNGEIIKYNLTDSSILWNTSIFLGANTYDLKLSLDFLYGSLSNGVIFKLDYLSGSIALQNDVSTSFIKHIQVYDFDKDSSDELFVIDGHNHIKNFDTDDFTLNWNYSSFTSLVMNSIFSDLDNNSYVDIAGYSGDGKVFTLDVRGLIPNGVPAWTNISFSFDDEICGSSPKEQYYSWNGNQNTSYSGIIPESSGVQTLEMWIGDNASNFVYNMFQFYSIINVRLNSPLNDSEVQSNIPINLTFSESPLDVLYKWDSNDFTRDDPTTPSSETQHQLFISVTDQSQNRMDYIYTFLVDNTPISSITLVSPNNDSVVEGGETVSLSYSESPYLIFYNWNNAINNTELANIPSNSDTHILDIFASDEADNWIHLKYVFHTKIQIDLISHENNSVIVPNSQLVFEFGETPDYCEYKIDQNNFVLIPIISNTTVVIFVSISGTHHITIRINDSFNGRWNEEEYHFKVKILANVTSHFDDGFAESGDPVIIEYSDTPITKLFSWDGKKNSSRNPIIPSPDGPHYLDIYVGNIEGDFWHYHYEFTVDTNLIDILLVNPINNTKINTWENITIEFSEAPHQKSYQWNSFNVTDTLTPYPSNNTNFHLNITVFDEAGNTNSKVFYWTVDDIPILAFIDNHTDNKTYYSKQILNISFDEDPLIKWYSWNDNPSSPTLQGIPYGNDTHILNITTYDGLNWNSQLFSINTIDLPPIITVEGINSSFMGNTEISVNISEEWKTSWHQWDNSSIIDGLSIYTPESEGLYNLTIYAEDLGNSYSYYSVIINIDTTPVKIISIDPENNSNVNGNENISILFDESPYFKSYSWNGNTRTTNLSSIPIEVGTHVLNIIAFDKAGNALNVDIIYKISSELEKFGPFIISGLFGIAALSTLAIWQHKLILRKLGSLVKKFSPPESP